MPERELDEILYDAIIAIRAAYYGERDPDDEETARLTEAYEGLAVLLRRAGEPDAQEPVVTVATWWCQCGRSSQTHESPVGCTRFDCPWNRLGRAAPTTEEP